VGFPPSLGKTSSLNKTRSHRSECATGPTSVNHHDRWYYILVPAQAYVGKFLETFKSYPPRQKPANFTVGGQMEALENALSTLEGDIN